MREDSINAEIEEFSEEWQEIFEKMAGEIGLEIQMMQDGDIEIPGAEGPRKYDRAGDLSDAEITFMNISFAVAYNRFVRSQIRLNGQLSFAQDRTLARHRRSKHLGEVYIMKERTKEPSQQDHGWDRTENAQKNARLSEHRRTGVVGSGGSQAEQCQSLG